MPHSQRMTMHLNGGRKFSELHYDIFCDGKPTAFRRRVRTNGRPKYKIELDIFYDGSAPDDESRQFDMLKTKGVGLQEWLNRMVVPLESKPPEENKPDQGSHEESNP